MPFNVRCPQCGKTLVAPDGAEGRHGRCNKCNCRFKLSRAISTAGGASPASSPGHHESVSSQTAVPPAPAHEEETSLIPVAEIIRKIGNTPALASGEAHALIEEQLKGRPNLLAELYPLLNLPRNSPGDSYVFGKACWLLGNYHEAAMPAVPKLIEIIVSNPSEHAASGALIRIGISATEQVLAALRQCDGRSSTSADAAMCLRQALAGYGDAVIPRVLQELQTVDIRSYYGRMLLMVFNESGTRTDLSPVAIYDAIAPFTGHQNLDVRRIVAKAYWLHAEKVPWDRREDYVPVLAALTKDPDEEVSTNAKGALWHMKR